MLCHRSPASRDRGLLFSHPRLIVGRDYLLCIDAHTSTLNLVIPFSVDKQRIRSISTMVLVLNLVLNLVLYLVLNLLPAYVCKHVQCILNISTYRSTAVDI